MKFVYGVTTVPERFDTVLPVTLDSLAAAGFDKPRLFVDGASSLPAQFVKYEATFRNPRIRVFGNWILSLAELYIRNPQGTLYGIFQDDILASKNLREYLEKSKYPERGYWNLYTFPENEQPKLGWSLSNQLGKGALGLVFSNEAVRLLLASKYIADRPIEKKIGWRNVDGGVIEAFRHHDPKWQEYVHNPSLLLHQDGPSSLSALITESGEYAGGRSFPKAETFRGTDFDAMSMFVKPVPVQPRHYTRIGLVGYNCNTGLGELNRQIATHCNVERWLVQPHPQVPTNDNLDVDTIICLGGLRVEEFVKSVDTILFCERPLYPELLNLAKRHRKRVVCVPMMEWMPSGAKGWPEQVDLFVCPTQQCYDIFKDNVPCICFPWPVDTQRFSYQPRDICHKFLFINGHGGYGGRKGGDVIRQAFDIWPSLPLLVRSQKSDNWPVAIEVLAEEPSNTMIYSKGDVLISPHSVDGLGLEPMEAMACGMPVISTNGPPWNEIPAIARISSYIEKRKVRRPVDWYLPRAEDLVIICKSLLNQNIRTVSMEARAWAEAHAWNEATVARFERIVRGEETVGS